MSAPLRKDVQKILSSLPDAHPARSAFGNGTPAAGLLRLLKNDQKAYDELLRAVMAWSNRILKASN
jgi:hypothetical protein